MPRFLTVFSAVTALQFGTSDETLLAFACMDGVITLARTEPEVYILYELKGHQRGATGTSKRYFAPFLTFFPHQMCALRRRMSTF